MQSDEGVLVRSQFAWNQTYLRRLQLIMQSANGTAYDPHFAKEKQRS